MSKRTSISIYSLGGLFAIVLSFVVNKSILWSFVHFFFAWVYVLWALVMHRSEIAMWTRSW